MGDEPPALSASTGGGLLVAAATRDGVGPTTLSTAVGLLAFDDTGAGGGATSRARLSLIFAYVSDPALLS